MASKNMSENLHTIFDGTACPRCDCNDATRVKTVNLGDGAFIRSCSLCNWATGIDDSVNLCDLSEENWEFQPNDGESGSCLENANHHPICMGFSQFGVIRSRCRNCKKTGIMFYKGLDFNSGNGEFRDSVFGTIFKNITEECDTTNEARLFSGMLQELAGNDELSECLPPMDVDKGDQMELQDTDSVFGTTFKNITEECDATNEARLLTGMLQELAETEELSECVLPMDVDQGDQMELKCDCHNGNPEFFNQIQSSSGSVMELTSVQCNANYSPDLDSSTACIVCDKCNSNVEDCFDKTYESGKLIKIQSDTAQKFSKTDRVFENTDYIRKDRVSSWDMIERGNHISWQRDLFYEHHAIVFSVHPHDKKMKVVEYGFKFAIINGKPRAGVVQEREETIEDFQQIFLYRYDYDPANCYPPEEVIERAQSRIEERLYNVFAKNCEHFATWCKTGKEYCSQIIPVARRVGQSAVAFISQLSIPLINLIKGEVFQIIVSGATVDDVVDFTVQRIAKLNKVEKAFMVGRVGFTVLLNLVVELCMFYRNYNEAKADFERGKITKTEFRKRKFELIGESIGGLTLGLLLGFTWLFGLGIIATLILNVLGIAGGRLCGAWIGRKLHNLRLKA